MSTDTSDLTKVTVFLTPLATASLNAAAAQMRDTKTDTINRALIWYRYSTRESFGWVVRWVLIYWGCIFPSMCAAAVWDNIPNWIGVPAVLASALLGVLAANYLNRRPKPNPGRVLPTVETS